MTRNRIKRRLREQLRRYVQEGRLCDDRDIVVIARSEAAQLDGPALAHALDELLSRANLWKGKAP